LKIAAAVQSIVHSTQLEEETQKSPRGLAAFGVFLLWGATMAFLAAITLTWRGTVLDRVWALNPAGYKQLAPYGGRAGILFATLGITLAATGIAWFKKLLGAWRLAIALIAAQVAGSIVNILIGRIPEGAIGITVSGALLFYLLRRRVRAVFRKPGQVLDSRDPGGPQPSPLT
jgi:hypothetical protein